MTDVIVVIGAGSIGQAIARRVSAGKHVVLADLHQANADAAAQVLRDAGFSVTATTVDIASRPSIEALVETATSLGDVTGLIHAAGVSPSQAPPAAILNVDLYGTAVILEAFGDVIAAGGSGVVIASQSGHRLGALSAEQDAALATTPAEDLLALPMLQPGQVTDSLHAYQLAKRCNSLRVMAEAVRWAKRGARINTISPGIIMTSGGAAARRSRCWVGLWNRRSDRVLGDRSVVLPVRVREGSADAPVHVGAARSSPRPTSRSGDRELRPGRRTLGDDRVAATGPTDRWTNAAP
jgi:NAD(P)-dependent dehydrogenase (short-subunit alcohol dehydrogenase family)